MSCFKSSGRDKLNNSKQRAPSMGYYQVSESQITSRSRNVFLLGKGKNFNQLNNNINVSEQPPLSIKYDLIETRYPIIDFTKI